MQRGDYKKLTGCLLALLLLLPSLSSRVAAQQPAPAATGDELWITVRLTPGVTEETLLLINELVEPEERTIHSGENLRSVLKEVYGDAYVRASALLQKYNTEDTLTRLREGKGGQLFLPLGPLYRQNVIARIPQGGSLRALIERATGLADGETLNRVKQYTSSLKKYCAPGRGCTSEELALVKGKDVVALPFASRYVSFRLKSTSSQQLSAALSRLEAARGVTEVEVHKALRLVPNFDLSEANDISAGCVTDPLSPDWPAQHLALLRAPVEDLRAADVKTTVAILDTGIVRNDSRFTLWENEREVMGVDGVDDDKNDYADDKNGFDFVNRRPFPADDAFGGRYQNHGTHVAGLASGVFFSSPPSEGVKSLLAEASRHVRPMILKVAWEDGSVDNGAVIEAIQYARDMGASVVNMSFAGPAFIKTIKREVAASPKMLFVAAAGNGDDHDIGQDLDAKDYFPAKFSKDFANVVSVAAHGEMRERPCFSNFGAGTVDLAAPGVQVESTVAGGYRRTNGTSQAAPLVSLTAALLHTLGLQEPTLIKQRLIATVDFVPGLRGQLTSEGVLNVAKALPFKDDLIEFNDADRQLLRGRIISPPSQIVVGDRTIKFADVRKIVNFSSESGTTLQRVTVSTNGRLEHIYGSLTLPKFKFKEKEHGRCVEVDFNSVSDIITATLPPAAAETCPE